MLILIIGVILFVLAISPTYAQSFGEELTIQEETPVSAIIDNPQYYVGKKVKVTGTLTKSSKNKAIVVTAFEEIQE